MMKRTIMLKRIMRMSIRKMMSMMNRQVDTDLGSVPSEEEYEGKAKLVIVLGDQERREPVYLGDTYMNVGWKRLGKSSVKKHNQAVWFHDKL